MLRSFQSNLLVMNTDTTRKQYEKKLENAVEKSSVKTFSDKTYYREEGGSLNARYCTFSNHLVRLHMYSLIQFSH